MKSLLSPFVLLGILLYAPYALATTGDAETAQQESEQKSDEASENPATSTEAQVLPEAEAEEAAPRLPKQTRRSHRPRVPS